MDSIKQFQSAVKRLAKDKICIIVTHDVSTVAICDMVSVLEDGRVRVKSRDEVLVVEG